ncbi:MAG TPA: HPr family phosphocarrier protein [Ktedonobacteraceae bacterium]
MASNEVVMRHEVGLHARPAAMFVQMATRFSSVIQVENLTKGSEPVNAKSILRLLSARVQNGDRVRISAEGEDEKQAVAALSRLIETNFDETENKKEPT